MILCDAGPLVALIDRADPNHAKCVAAAKRLPNAPLLTTWPCFTEAMYLSHRGCGYAAQARLWQYRNDRRLVLHEATPVEVDRMSELMARYRDVPMDLADASLIATAELLNADLIFTLDSDFYIYRLIDGSALSVFP